MLLHHCFHVKLKDFLGKMKNVFHLRMWYNLIDFCRAFHLSNRLKEWGKLVIFDYKSLLGFYGLRIKNSTRPRKAYYIFHNDWMYSKTSSYFIEKGIQKHIRTSSILRHKSFLSFMFGSSKYLNSCFCVNILGLLNGESLRLWNVKIMNLL